jgi:hypothetical protein
LGNCNGRNAPAGASVGIADGSAARSGSARDCRWREVRVGMLLEVRDGEDFLADLLCLHCASPNHVCYVKTTNLDGPRARRCTCLAWRR